MKNVIILLISVFFFSFQGFTQKNDAEIGNDNDVEEEVFVIVEVMPEFQGGKQGLINYGSVTIYLVFGNKNISS